MDMLAEKVGNRPMVKNPSKLSARHNLITKMGNLIFPEVALDTKLIVDTALMIFVQSAGY